MKSYVSIEDLVLMGCDEQDAIDWYSVRGRKKLTTRGLKTIIKEASMLGWPLRKAVRKMADKEWIGFEAAWVNDDGKQEMGFIERITDTSWADELGGKVQ